MAYIIKVTIENTHPPVWRRILIPEKTTFEDLHEVLQTAFGWENEHMHSFSFPQRGIEIVQSGEEGYGECVEEDKAVIDDFLPCSKWIRYTYDFGDNWEHKIVFEKMDDTYEERHAHVIKAKGDHFMEDSGGVWGGAEERISCSIEEINSCLARYTITPGKSSRRAKELAGMLRDAEAWKSAERNRRKYLLEMLRKAWEQETEREEVLSGGLFHETSGRMLMAEEWRDFVCCGEKGEICSVNLEEAEGTIADRLAELSNMELQSICLYLQLSYEESFENHALADIIGEVFKKHPEYLLYVLESREYLFLKKLWGYPARRSCVIDEQWKQEAVIKGISLGLLSVEVTGKAPHKVMKLSFAADVGELWNVMPDEKVESSVGEIRKISGRLESLIATYSVIDMEALYEIYVQMYRHEMEKEEFLRFIYWHICYMGIGQTYTTEENIEYVAMEAVDVEYVLAQLREYGVDIPYKRFRRKDLLNPQEGFGENRKQWNDLQLALQQNFALNEEETLYWVNEIYGWVQNGESAAEIWMDLSDCFEFTTIVGRSEYTALVTELCLATPIPMLKGYSRLEYSRMMQKEPWELGLFDWDISWAEEGEPDIDMGLFCLPPRLHYELYSVMTLENSRKSFAGTVQRIIMEYGQELPDLKYMLAVAYIKDGDMEKAHKILGEVLRQADDEGAEELRSLLGEVMEEDEENIIPFRRGGLKVGRNAPCPCGSGKKFKKCCMGKGMYD